MLNVVFSMMKCLISACLIQRSSGEFLFGFASLLLAAFCLTIIFSPVLYSLNAFQCCKYLIIRIYVYV